MVTHSSILAWRITRTEKPGGYIPLAHKESNTIEQLPYNSGAKVKVALFQDYTVFKHFSKTFQASHLYHPHNTHLTIRAI